MAVSSVRACIVSLQNSFIAEVLIRIHLKVSLFRREFRLSEAESPLSAGKASKKQLGLRGDFDLALKSPSLGASSRFCSRH